MKLSLLQVFSPHHGISTLGTLSIFHNTEQFAHPQFGLKALAPEIVICDAGALQSTVRISRHPQHHCSMFHLQPFDMGPMAGAQSVFRALNGMTHHSWQLEDII